MFDLKLIRDNPDLVREALAHRKDSGPVDEILALDTERRQKLTQLEELRHARKGGKMAPEEGRKLRDQLTALETETNEMDAKMKDYLLRVPNLPDASVPVGSSEEDNVVVRTIGEAPKMDFKALPHWELGEKLGIIDFERGVKISGSRFYVLNGMGARLQSMVIKKFICHSWSSVRPCRPPATCQNSRIISIVI
jgi:seryl-tRNA synthetase